MAIRRVDRVPGEVHPGRGTVRAAHHWFDDDIADFLTSGDEVAEIDLGGHAAAGTATYINAAVRDLPVRAYLRAGHVYLMRSDPATTEPGRCPFCGAPMEVSVGTQYHHHLRCTNPECGADVLFVPCRTPEEAVSRFNRRSVTAESGKAAERTCRAVFDGVDEGHTMAGETWHCSRCGHEMDRFEAE